MNVAPDQLIAFLQEGDYVVDSFRKNGKYELFKFEAGELIFLQADENFMRLITPIKKAKYQPIAQSWTKECEENNKKAKKADNFYGEYRDIWRKI